MHDFVKKVRERVLVHGDSPHTMEDLLLEFSEFSEGEYRDILRQIEDDIATESEQTDGLVRAKLIVKHILGQLMDSGQYVQALKALQHLLDLEGASKSIDVNMSITNGIDDDIIQASLKLAGHKVDLVE